MIMKRETARGFKSGAGYRSCAFCGAKKHKKKLLRITLPDVRFDMFQTKGGRGFYTCINLKCIGKSLKKRSVLKYIDNADTDRIYDTLKSDIFLSLRGIISGFLEKGGLNPHTDISGYENIAFVIAGSRFDTARLEKRGIKIIRADAAFNLNDNDFAAAVTGGRVADTIMEMERFVINTVCYNGDTDGGNES